MNKLKIGDVVCLNSEKDVQMTVMSISEGEVQCVYFNQVEQKFNLTMSMPEEVVALSQKSDCISGYR
ncbi:hypothetical protein [uncultured Duncaniella sp.]|uniref:hypothetical protein n=1 Tax=uncultured Duncaniella sp. TaxID=2768039 RepID=UPI0025CFD1D5|nr:hypothetical protein [uncultured Duncaniella sp.]